MSQNLSIFNLFYHECILLNINSNLYTFDILSIFVISIRLAIAREWLVEHLRYLYVLHNRVSFPTPGPL